ncbi:hypothetical protein HAX54_042611 [Datura stramonium]|uniref:Uncharacterized protein n=1 Tax=Datura stramonium TaxID=4076 RepID=A0ABS8RPD5_DATST|nr:hypothetical protein [Datura stramonium]
MVITYKHDQVREEALVYCSACKTQIGLVEDHLDMMDNDKTGVFNSVCKLVYWNDLPMMSDDEQDEGDNIEHAGGANTAQVTNEQDGGANVEQVPDPDEQIGGANIGQVPNDQDGGADEQDPTQDVD